MANTDKIIAEGKQALKRIARDAEMAGYEGPFTLSQAAIEAAMWAAGNPDQLDEVEAKYPLIQVHPVEGFTQHHALWKKHFAPFL